MRLFRGKKKKAGDKRRVPSVLLAAAAVLLAAAVYCALFPDSVAKTLHVSLGSGLAAVEGKDFSMPTKPPTPTPVRPKPRPTPTLKPKPTAEPTPLPFLNYNPRTVYGEGMYHNFILGEEYDQSTKISTVTAAYYARLAEDGSPAPGYAERQGECAGCSLGIYYADDMPYFVEAMRNGQVQAWLYLWGSDVVACTDCRRDSEKLLKTDEELAPIRAEFAELYPIARAAYNSDVP